MVFLYNDIKRKIKNFCISGMEVIKIGGPVYRIGVGGGSASSIEVILYSKE